MTLPLPIAVAVPILALFAIAAVQTIVDRRKARR